MQGGSSDKSGLGPVGSDIVTKTQETTGVYLMELACPVV